MLLEILYLQLAKSFPALDGALEVLLVYFRGTWASGVDDKLRSEEG